MLQLLNPIYLLGLTALAIPVLIHLWNIRKARPVKVGSVRLYSESSAQRSTSLRVHQWLLLLLRCLIVILAAILVAVPLLTRRAGSDNTGWLLVAPGHYQQSKAEYPSMIDSLLNSGFELRSFEPGFPTLDPTEENGAQRQSTVSYWELAAELSRVSEGRALVLITDNRLKHFYGERAAIGNDLRWHLLHAADSALVYVEQPYYIGSDSIQYFLTRSTPYASQSERTTASLLGTGTEAMVRVDKGQLSISAGTQNEIVIDTPVINIQVFADAGMPDLRYLSAALEAISAHTRIRFNVEGVDTARKADWLFWLSGNEPAVNHANRVFQYAGNIDTIASPTLIANNSITPVQMYRRFLHDLQPTEQPLWTDGAGNPILTRLKDDDAVVFNFLSRFNPVYSNLHWHASFPELLMQLIIGENDTEGSIDNRAIALEQMKPAIIDKQSVRASQVQTEENISKEIWLILFCLVVLERFFSMKKTGMNGRGNV